jgi:hypothetical protein
MFENIVQGRIFGFMGEEVTDEGKIASYYSSKNIFMVMLHYSITKGL